MTILLDDLNKIYKSYTDTIQLQIKFDQLQVGHKYLLSGKMQSGISPNVIETQFRLEPMYFVGYTHPRYQSPNYGLGTRKYRFNLYHFASNIEIVEAARRLLGAMGGRYDQYAYQPGYLAAETAYNTYLMNNTHWLKATTKIYQ